MSDRDTDVVMTAVTEFERTHYRNTRAELRRLGHEAAMYSRHIRSATDWNHKVAAEGNWKLTRSRMAHEITIWAALRAKMKANLMRSAAE